MGLSLHTDYSLRMLMFLAGADRRCTITEIAEFFGISKDHLAKVAQRLARLGYVRSLRGVGGGLELAKDPANIRIGDVVEDMEGTTQLLECVRAEQTVCAIQPGCKLRGVLAEAERIQMEYLNSVTIADVATPGESLVTLTH